MFWSIGPSTALAALDKAAHRRDEPVLCRHADCLLRGQWKAVADLEGPSSLHLLAIASSSRSAAHHSGAVVAPVSSSDAESGTSLRATLRLQRAHSSSHHGRAAAASLRLHPAMPTVEGGPATIRAGLGPRNQTRRLPAHGAPRWRARPLLHTQRPRLGRSASLPSLMLPAASSRTNVCTRRKRTCGSKEEGPGWTLKGPPSERPGHGFGGPTKALGCCVPAVERAYRRCPQ